MIVEIFFWAELNFDERCVMRLAVISDIHGNYEALRSVYADIQNSNVDKIVCLGDIVGYGPQPEECIQFIMDKDIPCILGNHEIAVHDDMRLRQLRKDAKKSILLTKELLSEKSLSFIRGLPINYSMNNMLFVHGFPPDSVTSYLEDMDDDDILMALLFYQEQVAFVGHTHKMEYICSDGKRLKRMEPLEGPVKFNGKYRYLINVGSVGQPRDGILDARYLVFNDSDFKAEMRFVPYDIEKTANLIEQKGFPQNNADRLFRIRI